LWTNRLASNIQAIIFTQTQVAIDDLAQLADKIVEVTPPPCVARVPSSDDDVCTLTARIDELDRQVAALSPAPLAHVHHRRHDGTKDVRHSLRDGHQPLTSAGNTAVLKSLQRHAPRPVRGSRETRKAVAGGGEQLQQLSQPTLFDGSVHKDEFLGRHQQRSLCLPTFQTSRTPDTD
jgi:hypothetical protein